MNIRTIKRAVFSALEINSRGDIVGAYDVAGVRRGFRLIREEKAGPEDED